MHILLFFLIFLTLCQYQTIATPVINDDEDPDKWSTNAVDNDGATSYGSDSDPFASDGDEANVRRSHSSGTYEVSSGNIIFLTSEISRLVLTVALLQERLADHQRAITNLERRLKKLSSNPCECRPSQT